jgi:hypothetical protein
MKNYNNKVTSPATYFFMFMITDDFNLTCEIFIVGVKNIFSSVVLIMSELHAYWAGNTADVVSYCTKSCTHCACL